MNRWSEAKDQVHTFCLSRSYKMQGPSKATHYNVSGTSKRSINWLAPNLIDFSNNPRIHISPNTLCWAHFQDGLISFWIGNCSAMYRTACWYKKGTRRCQYKHGTIHQPGVELGGHKGVHIRPSCHYLACSQEIFTCWDKLREHSCSMLSHAD